MKNRLLLIIDPQIDFITGSLPVSGASEVMNRLAAYISSHSNEYCRIAVTADRHPFNHCSFVDVGGEWPAHCVADSMGAAIWPPVMEALACLCDKVSILHKGECLATDEYSIFKSNEESARLIELVKSNHICEIDICGLAGDVCVADTIIDGLTILKGVTFKVLTKFTASIDNGETLAALIDNYNLSCDR